MKPRGLARQLRRPIHYGKTLFTISRCKLLLLRWALRHRRWPKWIVTRPDVPSPHSAFFKICHRLGYRITTDARRTGDLIIAWEDATVRRPDAALDALAASHRVLNYRCVDIGKQRMAEVFAEVFGYSLAVNPSEYHGLMLRKANANASHDGTVLSGPIADQSSEFTYQKLVDNIVDGFLEDLRLPVSGDHFPYCMRKRVPIKDRFTLASGTGKLCAVEEVFTPEEIANLTRFCRTVGLDYGEMDVLRDSQDGRIYIVDVNNTPYGPSSRWARRPGSWRTYLPRGWYLDATSWSTLDRLAEGFEKAFCR